MILADKIIQLRKKNGWSQEELAEKLGVSRQAVSKWEGAQATPDLNKLLAMSRLFGVTTDYLLKDDMEAEEYAQSAEEAPLRRISLREAGEFLAWRKKASLLIAAAVLLCVFGIVALLTLPQMGNYASLGVPGDVANALGLGALLLFAAGAAGLFLYCGHKNSPYEYLEKEDFDAEYGVEGMAEKRSQEDEKTVVLLRGAGIGLCILSPLPLVCGALLGIGELLQSLLLCLTLLLAGVGAALCIVAGVRRAATDKLLREGEYTAQGKRRSRLLGPVSTVFWLLTTAVYLAWSFLGSSWEISWVVWPVAGVLYAAVAVLCRALADRREA